MRQTSINGVVTSQVTEEYTNDNLPIGVQNLDEEIKQSSAIAH